MNITLGRLMLLGVLFASVLGCQIEELDKGDDIHEVVLFAHNGLAQVTPDKSDFIDLADFVQSGAGVETRLERVVLINNPKMEHCNAPIELTDKGLGFNSTLKAGELCQYRYTVKGEHPQVDEVAYQDGVVTVVGSTATDVMMTPIAYAMEMTSPTEIIDIAYELDEVGDMFPSDYTLHGEVILLGDGEVLDVDSAAQTVTYEAHNEGSQRIIYILEDDNGTEHKYGRIDIAVSSGPQQGPIVDSDTIYDGLVKVNEQVTIDVSQWVTLPPDDSDAYHLTYVDSFNATVALSAPDDIMNKEFTFKATEEGEHHVVFSVSDHQGGYDLGVMEVRVSCNNLAKDCLDIFKLSNGGLFTNSPSVAYLDSIGDSENMGIRTEDGAWGPAGDFYQFNGYHANKLCKTYNTKKIGGRTNWRLPEIDELTELYDNYGNMFAARGWPTYDYYWSKTPDYTNQYYRVHLYAGSDDASYPNVEGYVSCISEYMSLANKRLDFFELGSGKLFANSPSVVYLDSIGGSVNDDGLQTEDGIFGPAGDFYVFNWDNAKKLCEIYNYRKIGRRTNWRFPEKDELVELYDVHGNMFAARGWPTTRNYWSSTPNGNDYYNVSLNSGGINSSPQNEPVYVSCVSDVTLADGILDIFDPGNDGKLYTNSPSVAYLNGSSIGGTHNGIYTEFGNNGPAGDFYQFHWVTAYERCETYNTMSIGGRENWRLATKDELKEELYDVYGNMFAERGWPTSLNYWSSTSDGYDYYNVNLNNGDVNSDDTKVGSYVSCVSEPTLANEIFDIFHASNRMLYTNSPSVAYLDSIGGSENSGFRTEDGTYGLAGDFYVFNWDNANQLCETYNTKSIRGRTNWRLPEIDELTELYDNYGNMFAARGWPTVEFYWSVTFNSSWYYSVSLGRGDVGSFDPRGAVYVSCVSELTLADEILDIFDLGNGLLYTNSPSVAYLDSIGGSHNGIYTEVGNNGPAGDFYLFNWDNANELCETYNTKRIGGRTGWRLPSKYDLEDLYINAGNMFTARDWPTSRYYWSRTPDGSNYYYVSLNNGGENSYHPNGSVYVSCVTLR